MLTELFLIGRPKLEAIAAFLRERAASFGEALQLVNILKDSAGDAAEGRTYLPPAVSRSEVFSLARQDLQTAGAYIGALQSAEAPRGLVEFTALPVLLARASLERIEKAWAGLQGRPAGGLPSDPEAQAISGPGRARRLTGGSPSGPPPHASIPRGFGSRTGTLGQRQG